MTPFLVVMGGQPQAKVAASAEIGAAASNIDNLANLIRTSASVAGWSGPSKDAQQNRLGQFMTLFQQLLTSMSQIQATTSAGAAQMQTAKLATEATVTAAQSGRYLVLPTGTVQPGGWHYAFASTHPGAMGVFRGIAAMLTTHIQTSVAASKSVDTQVAAAVAQVALDYLGGWLDQKFFPGASGTPTTSLPPGIGTTPGGIVPVTTPGTTLPVGTAPILTPAGDLTPSGFGTQLAGAGAGPLGGAPIGGGPFVTAGLTGGAGASVVAAGMVLGGGTAGAPPAGVAGGPGGAAARGVGAAPMMPFAPHGGAGATGDERQAAKRDLTEDEQPWGQGDAPDAVLR